MRNYSSLEGYQSHMKKNTYINFLDCAKKKHTNKNKFLEQHKKQLRKQA